MKAFIRPKWKNAILEHPDVEMAVVIRVPDPKWKEGIKAICKLKAGKKLLDRERIVRHKKPQYI